MEESEPKEWQKSTEGCIEFKVETLRGGGKDRN